MFKYFIVIFFILTINSYAEIVSKLKVQGNNRISAETIKVYGEISFGKDYSSFDIDKILKNLYKTEFFEDITISLNNEILTIEVKEYQIISSVDFRGEKSTQIKKKIIETLSLQSKGSFIENKLTNDIDTIKKIYSSLGFNFIDVDAKIERFSGNQVNLIYFLTKGKKTNIKNINFLGDKKIREKRLRDIIVSEEKKFWKVLSKNTYLNYKNIELDKRLLINYYKSLGYYDVQVLSNNAEVSVDNFTNLTYTINAGTRYRVNKISTNVSEVLDKKLFLPLKDNFSKVVGKYYSPFTVKKLLDNLDILISNNDLQFIEHSVNEILEDDTIEIKINIFEGEKLLVEKINILGNTVTDETVIRSSLLLDEGDPFNALKLDQSIAKIKSKGIFAEVKNKVMNGAVQNQKIIEISVEEKPTGEISAGAGFGTNGGTFAFNVQENNWLGKGLSIGTNVSISAESFSGNLKVIDPNYNFSGNSLTYYASNTTNDKPNSGYKNNIVAFGIGTKFEQYKNIYLSPNISYSYDNLKVESTASESLKKQKGEFSDLSFDYSVTRDERDRVYSPTAGYITSFGQAVPIYADSPYLQNTFKFSTYKSLTPNAISSIKFFGQAINGLNDKDVRLNKRARLSAKRLRGFKAGRIGPKDGVDYVGGNYAVATNFEVNLPNLLPESTKTDIALFLDLGSVWGVDYDSTVGESNTLRSSTGVSTNWSSPLGPMSFIFSQNITKDSTDEVEGFNFRLGTTF